MTWLFQVLNALLVLGYFVLADQLGPRLVAAGEKWLWWLILSALVGISYLFARFVPPGPRTRGAKIRTLEVVAYVLLAITLFLYDFTVRPALVRQGLGDAWILSMVLLFAVLAAIIWTAPPQSSR